MKSTTTISTPIKYIPLETILLKIKQNESVNKDLQFNQKKRMFNRWKYTNRSKLGFC